MLLQPVHGLPVSSNTIEDFLEMYTMSFVCVQICVQVQFLNHKTQGFAKKNKEVYNQ